MDDELCSVVRDDGVVAAVFEADSETAYFYLVDTTVEGWEIVHAHPVPERRPGETAATVRWSKDGELAALFRGDRIVAVLDLDEASQDRTRAGREARAEDLARFDLIH